MSVNDQASPERLPEQYVVRAIRGLPDFRPGDDLAAAICLAAPWLADGDILAVTSKAISKVEGQLVPTGESDEERVAARQRAIDSETRAVVAQRGGVRIVRTHHGLTMAAAGVDASNVNASEIALLPADSDASARALREAIRATLGCDVAVIITDTVGRPWRGGLVDIALGSSGIPALRDLRGTVDTHGHPLAVTALAQVDEIASASELVRGKLGRVAAAVIRGIPWQEDNAGTLTAGQLVRPGEEDMFSFGSRDLVPATRRSVAGGESLPDENLATAAHDAIARLGHLGKASVSYADRAIRLSCADQFQAGVIAGQLAVALRAEGLTAAIAATSDGALLRLSPAAPYEGIPR